ncbi:CPBP family intramembrane glutamic endopeptidase [Dactylosporangium sp. NPDC048998]|uniref:CPBP family intramembrane glutamic endopeptidase n=1 Tax=Dactylosporangium sp. NPDC048998 TaxID=3363976 RepID=UPI003711B8DB
MTTIPIRGRGATRPVRRLARTMQWPAVLAMHLLPAAATFAAAFALGPLVRAWHLPPQFALTLAFALVLTPIELGLLLRAAGWSFRRLPEVLAFRRKLPLRLYLMIVPCLTAIGFGLVVLLAPLEERILDVYPSSWLLPAGSDAFPASTTVATLLFALLIDGLVNPAVEELYFRAYLLPRLPVRGVLAVVTSAALFAAQHYWQPEKFVFIFVAQLLLIAVMLRLNSVRMSIAVHCFTNSLAILLSLAAVLR